MIALAKIKIKDVTSRVKLISGILKLILGAKAAPILDKVEKGGEIADMVKQVLDAIKEASKK